ncbi:MAG: hypothetical protein JJE30_18270 [Desulfuromonadales bacterium]|nr:hypothetical protein [Desulfuromonadales bacterium]
MKWLGTSNAAVKDFLNLTVQQQQEIDKLRTMELSSCDEVRSIVLEGADIGVAAISSVISILREPKPDILEHMELVRINLISAARVFFSLLNHIRAEHPHTLIVFNGRYAQLRPALSAARLLEVETCVHERASVLDRFSLSINTTTHDLGAMQQEMLRISKTSELDESEKQKLAFEWYEERRGNVTQGWESYTAHQQWGHLPELATDRLNLVIFISSEDELEAFEEWRNPYYPDQNEGIELLLSDARLAGKFKIFVREHPNLQGIDNSQTRRIRNLAERYPDFQLISAESPVSTYSLLDQSDVVLTFGSTVGIEAVYKGKPSFLIGRAYYENLGCCVQPASHEELITLLCAFAVGDRTMLPPAELCREAVVTYGLYSKLWGQTFNYVKVHGLRTVTMTRGDRIKLLRPSLFSWLVFQCETLFKRGRIS